MSPADLLDKLTRALEEHEERFEISNKTWKVKVFLQSSSNEGEEAISELSQVKIEVLKIPG